MFVTYHEKVYSITDLALSHLDLQIIKGDDLREPGVLLVLATERTQQRRVAAPQKRLALVR